MNLWLMVLAAEAWLQDTFEWVKKGKLSYQPEPYVREWKARQLGWSTSDEPICWWPAS